MKNSTLKKKHLFDKPFPNGLAAIILSSIAMLLCGIGFFVNIAAVVGFAPICFAVLMIVLILESLVVTSDVLLIMTVFIIVLLLFFAGLFALIILNILPVVFGCSSFAFSAKAFERAVARRRNKKLSRKARIKDTIAIVCSIVSMIFGLYAGVAVLIIRPLMFVVTLVMLLIILLI